MPPIVFATNRRPNHATEPTDFGGEFSRNGLALQLAVLASFSALSASRASRPWP